MSRAQASPLLASLSLRCERARASAAARGSARLRSERREVGTQRSPAAPRAWAARDTVQDDDALRKLFMQDQNLEAAVMEATAAAQVEREQAAAA